MPAVEGKLICCVCEIYCLIVDLMYYDNLVKVKQGCGFFLWEDEQHMSMMEKNNILEARVEELVAEMEVIQHQLSAFKGRNEQGSHGAYHDFAAKLKEENTILTTKIAKLKVKKRILEEQVKTLKANARKCEGGKFGFWFWFLIVLFISVLLRVV